PGMSRRAGVSLLEGHCNPFGFDCYLAAVAASSASRPTIIAAHLHRREWEGKSITRQEHLLFVRWLRARIRVEDLQIRRGGPVDERRPVDRPDDRRRSILAFQIRDRIVPETNIHGSKSHTSAKSSQVFRAIRATAPWHKV